jgi:hypothetical protein
MITMTLLLVIFSLLNSLYADPQQDKFILNRTQEKESENFLSKRIFGWRRIRTFVYTLPFFQQSKNQKLNRKNNPDKEKNRKCNPDKEKPRKCNPDKKKNRKNKCSMAKIRKGSPEKEENEKNKSDMRTAATGSDSLNNSDKKTTIDMSADNHKQTDLRKESKERKLIDGRAIAHKESKTSVDHGPDVRIAERTDNVHRDKIYIEDNNIKMTDDTTADPKKTTKRDETKDEKERAHREKQRHVDTATTADQGQAAHGEAAMAANRMSADYEHVRREAKRKADMTTAERREEEERTENRRNVREERGTDNEGVTSSTQGRII